MAGIFINYRRDDSRGMTGRLYDHLCRTFGSDSVFMDVDAMKPGLDFVKQLDAQVAQCNVVLAIIGTHWFDAKDDKGQRRLDLPHDYVRVELAAALTRDIPVIPILIDGAVMPSEEALPDDLKSLARRHALELRYTRFNSDAQGIELALRDLLPRRKPRWFLPAIGGGMALVTIAALVVWRMWPGPLPVEPMIKPPAPIVAPITLPRPPEKTTQPAQRTATGPKELQVSLGDSLEHVKSVYHIVSQPFKSGNSLGFRLPLSGIYFFFDANNKLENIRVDAPFAGAVEGVHIGDPVSGILSRFGEPYTTPWDFGDNKAYAYRIGGRVVRFDVDKAGKVATIFQFTGS